MDERRNVWAGIALALGILAGMGLGAILALVFTRRSRQLQPQPVAGPPLSAPPPMMALPPPAMPPPISVPKHWSPPAQGPLRPTTGINTRRLPALATAGSQAIRVASAGAQAIRVTLRPIGPPGSFAVFSESAAELNTPGLAATIPTGFVFSIPVGDKETIDIHAKQALYAKGNVEGVNLSIATALVPAER